LIALHYYLEKYGNIENTENIAKNQRRKIKVFDFGAGKLDIVNIYLS